MSVGTSSATLTVTVDQSPVQAVLSTASLEYDTTEWNGVLIADAIMTSVLTNDFVAEELDDFLQALYAAHFPGDAIVSAETVAVVEGFHGEHFHVSLEQAKKVKGLNVRRLAILCRTKQGRVFLHTEKHSEKDTLGGYESVPLQGDGAEHINAYVMHLAQLDPTISFDDDEDEYDEETISELQDYVLQASDLVAHEGLQAVVFAGKLLFKATKAGASIAGTVASAVALGAWGMAIGALEAESEPVTVDLQSSDEPGSSDSVTLAIGATIVTRKRNSPLVELIQSAEAFTGSELLERFPEGQHVGEVNRPGVMRAETGTYRASSRRRSVRVDPRLWRSLRWIDLGGADIYQPFRKYFEGRIEKDGAIVKLDRQDFERIMREAVENPDRGVFGFKSDPIEKYAAKEIEDVLDRLINNLDANVVLTVNQRVYAPNPHDPYAYLLEEFHDMLRFTLGFTTRRLEEAFGVVNIIHRYEHDPANRVEQSEKIDNASLHPFFRTKDNQTLGKDFKDPNKWASLEALKVARSAHVWGPGRSLRYMGAPEYVVEGRIRIRSHLADFETWRDVTPDHAFVTLPDDSLKAQPVSADRRERLIKNMLYANKHKQVSGDGMPTDLRVNTVVAVERRGSVNRAMKRSREDASGEGEERVEERPQQEDVRMYYVPYASLDRQEDFIVDAVHEFINTYVGFTTQEFDEALSDALQIRKSAKHLLPVRLHPNFMLSGERVADGGAQADDVRDRFLDKYDPQRLGERPGTTEQRPGTIRKVAQGGIRAVKKVGQKLFYAQQSAAAKETHRYDELHVLGLKPDADDDEFRAFSGAGTRVDKGRAGQEETIKDQFLTKIKAQRTQAVPVAAPVPRTRRSLVKYAERNHAAAVELTEQRVERERKLLELRTLFKDKVRRTKSVWPAEALVRRLEQVHYVLFDNNVVYKHETDDDCSLFAGDVPSGGVDYKCVWHKTPKAYHCTQTE